MTDQQINQAIAEACELKAVEESGLWSIQWPSGRYAMYRGGIDKRHAFAVGCPNFCNDLNAMHEAENVILSGQSDELVVAWKRWLRANSCFEGLHATARQRAEAFLHTIGKWRDT